MDSIELVFFKHLITFIIYLFTDISYQYWSYLFYYLSFNIFSKTYNYTSPDQAVVDMKFCQKKALIEFFTANQSFLNMKNKWNHKDWKKLVKDLNTLKDNQDDPYEVFVFKNPYDWNRVCY